MCADASAELIQQCLRHEQFQYAFERVRRSGSSNSANDRLRQQCCIIDLSRAVRSCGRRYAPLLRLFKETCSLYAAPPTRPPFHAPDAVLDAQNAEIARNLLLVIRLEDDLQGYALDCARVIRGVGCARRVFIDVAALPHIISIYDATIYRILRPWAATAAVVSDWLPYLARPLAAPQKGSVEAAARDPSADWHSVYIDVSEFSADTKWELLQHLLLLRDLKRLRLETGAICVIRWFAPENDRDALFLNFSSFLRGAIAGMGCPEGPALQFLCLARAWCQLHENGVDCIKLMRLLSHSADGGIDWLASTGRDSRHFTVGPDELQSILIRSYVDVVYPAQRLRESSELKYSMHASGGHGASPRPTLPPRPLPVRGTVQPMQYLEAVRGPSSAGSHPSYDFWQWVAHEAIWHVQVQLMAHGWLRIPREQLPLPPTLESISALNAREIQIQSLRERIGGPPL